MYYQGNSWQSFEIVDVVSCIYKEERYTGCPSNQLISCFFYGAPVLIERGLKKSGADGAVISDAMQYSGLCANFPSYDDNCYHNMFGYGNVH